MNNSIYISNTQIQIVGYAPAKGTGVRVQRYASMDLPEQVIINGIVTDAAALTDKLRQMQQQNPGMFANATLTIDSNAVLTKMLPVPVLKKEQYLEMAKHELANNSGAYDQLIYDYDAINDKNERSMLACAVNSPIIETYLHIFAALNVKLSAIYVGLDVVIHFVRNTPSLRDKKMALNIIDGMSMLSLIFENGKYIFSNRTRIIADSEDEFCRRVVQSLTSLAQFNKNFTVSYYIGATPPMIEAMRAMLPSHVEVELQGIDLMQAATGGKITDQCHFSYLGACAPQGCINLITTYQNSIKKPKKVRIKKIHIVLAAIVVILLGVFGFFKLQLMSVEKDNEDLEAFLTNPKHLEDVEYVRSKNTEVQYYSTEVQPNLDAIEKGINAVPQLNREVFQFLDSQLNGVVVLKRATYRVPLAMVDGVLLPDPTLELECTGKTALDTTAFVDRIKEYKEFSFIENPGFNETSEGVMFTIIIHLKVVIEEEAK